MHNEKQLNISPKMIVTPETRQQVEAMLDEFKVAVMRAMDDGRGVSIRQRNLFYSLRWTEGNGRIVGPGTSYDTGDATLEVRIGMDPDAKAKARAEYEATLPTPV